MTFEKSLPEWNALGVEPPETLKNNGWAAGNKPPADYWNWHMNTTYEALKELQEKAATSLEVTEAEQRSKDYTDEKVQDLGSTITPEQIGAAPKDEFDAHANDAGLHVTAQRQQSWDNKANAVHQHAASDITSGTFAVARLPAASVSAAGIVKLNNTTNSAATNEAATAAAVKAAMDQANAAFQSANNGKAVIAGVVGNVSAANTHQEIANRIQTDKDNIAWQIRNKGNGNAWGNQSLYELGLQIANIQTGKGFWTLNTTIDKNFVGRYIHEQHGLPFKPGTVIAITNRSAMSVIQKQLKKGQYDNPETITYNLQYPVQTSGPTNIQYTYMVLPNGYKPDGFDIYSDGFKIMVNDFYETTYEPRTLDIIALEELPVLPFS